MDHHLMAGADATSLPVTRESVEKLLADDEVFWLDLHSPSEHDFALLRDVFSFHPLALEDSEHFGQRPKVEEYDDFAFLALYGAAPDDDDLVEVHCFLAHRFLVTIHHDLCPAFAELRRRAETRRVVTDDPVALLHRVVDALVDSFFPLLSEFDDRIDELEDSALARANEEDLQQIFRLKRRLVGLRRIIGPQRDVLLAIVGGPVGLPGMTPDHERYFRDVYDHLIRLGDLIDTYRDLLSSSLDVYLSTVSNRLNGVMKQLAVIATIFLPLTFVTGFFGQNFEWMVRHVTGWPQFVALGLGVEALTLAGLMAMFRRRGWL
jgi:magnesium transporter